MSCFKGVTLFITKPTIKLILQEGTTRVLKGRRTRIKAGEIMFEFPDCVVCHADSFFLGRPIPMLTIHDKLVAGNTYFVLPLSRLPRPKGGGSHGGVLSPAFLASLGSSPSDCPRIRWGPRVKLVSSDNNNNKSPFEYIRGKDGRLSMIKIVPEFITSILTSVITSPNDYTNKPICTTPELQKQYDRLVRANKDQGWSPKLETITEHNKTRFSPCRFIGLEWKEKEKQV